MGDQKEKINNILLDENYKYWLGGFVEGEGSLVISVVKTNKAPFGFLLQPEFNVTQHHNGLQILNSFKYLFDQKGQIRKKSGSLNVWVYSLKGIKNLNKVLIPFYRKYVVCYFNKYKIEEFDKFCSILNKLDNKSKYSKDQFIRISKINIWTESWGER